jgi:alkylation response protein AidB-like acyl-CoA dehydrogenase
MGMTTTAVRSTDGTYYTVNGTKMWITNGTVDGVSTGDKFIVYVKTGKGRAATDLSAFVIEKGVTMFFTNCTSQFLIIATSRCIHRHARIFFGSKGFEQMWHACLGNW